MCLFTEVLVVEVNVVCGLVVGIDFAGGAGFVSVGVIEGNGGGFKEGAVLGVGKILSVLYLKLIRLSIDGLKVRLGVYRILDHGTELVIVEDVGPGDHSVVLAYLILPVQDVAVCAAAPLAVINPGGGDMGQQFARVKAGLGGEQCVST